MAGEIVIKINGVIGLDVLPNQLESPLAAGAARGWAPITVELNSEGGFCWDGINIANQLRDYQGKTTARISGLCASMASFVACSCDEITATRNSSVMIHLPWAAAIGNHFDLQKESEVLKGLSDILRDAYAERLNLSPDVVEQMLLDETWFFSSDLVDSGFVDRFVDEPKKTAFPVSLMDSLALNKGRAAACSRKLETGFDKDIRQVAKMFTSDDRQIIPGWNAGQVRKMAALGYSLDDLAKYGPGASGERN